MALLEIRNLTVEFAGARRRVRALDQVSLSLKAGETVGLVGESGCGKSVTALAIGRLLAEPPAQYLAGEIHLAGRRVLELSPAELRQLRGGMVSYVFQEPAASLNPVLRVGSQIQEALRLHRPAHANQAEVLRLLELVRLPAPELRARQYPFELSGGMQQRVMLAMALASEPKLLVADEPTTALDVTIQAQILELLQELRQRLGMSILLITHNLGIVAARADRVAVMYAGQIVELAPAAALIQRPLHPYTRALLAAVPRLGAGASRLQTIPGAVPRAGQAPPGCRFAERCPNAQPPCTGQRPELVEVAPERWVRCPFWQAGGPP